MYVTPSVDHVDEMYNLRGQNFFSFFFNIFFVPDLKYIIFILIIG